MSRLNRAFQLCGLLALVLTCAPSDPAQDTGHGHVLNLPPAKDTVVRFFYFPAVNNYFHVALLFRAVEENDPRLNTAPIFDVGRTAYITIPEMQQMIEGLSHSNSSWEESSEPQTLETPMTISCPHGGMCIKVLTPGGTAVATVRPDKICQTLAPLDAALKTPRALWEFQLWRVQYQCKVPNFNPDAYPDRIP